MAFLIVVLDICLLIWDSDLQMLQARELLCILLLVAGTLPAADSYAQNSESSLPDRTYQRLGDTPDSEEHTLDLTVPTREQQAPAETELQPQSNQRQVIEAELAAARKALQEGRS